MGETMKQGLKIFFDGEEDILYMAEEGQEEEFIELQPGINVELDKDRQVIGIEILHASEVLKEVIEPVRQKIKV